MSLKADLQTWADALKAYDSQSYEEASTLFSSIADNSKIYFNLGLIEATTGHHSAAVDSFELAIGADRYLAVAYFQAGVSNFLLGRWAEARTDFDDAYAYMRSNITIDYEQLGLNFRLYSCEVLFNRGLATIYNGDFEGGMKDLEAGQKEKQTAEHSVINDCIAERAAGYTVFSIPAGVLFRPPEQKLKNLATKNYLGTAKLVATADSRDAHVGFSGTNTPNSRNPERIGLSRSQTSLARLERTGDFEAKPLRRRPTLDALKAKASYRARSDRSELPEEDEEQESLRLAVPPRPQVMTRGLTHPATSSAPRTPERPSAKDSTLPTPPASDASRKGQLDRLPSRTAAAWGRAESSGSTTSQQQTPSRDPTYSFINSYLIAPEPSDPLPALPSRPALKTTQSAAAAPRELDSPAGEDDRVANWARQASRAPPPASTPSISRGNSASEKGSNLGGAGRNAQLGLAVHANAQRQLTRSPSNGFLCVKSPGGPGIFYGDENGTVVSTELEMVKVRIKLRFKGEVRGMSVQADMGLEDFTEKVRVKFGSPSDLAMKYRDAEGTEISIVDSDDWETAMDEAREAAQGKAEGKLEILLAEE